MKTKNLNNQVLSYNVLSEGNANLQYMIPQVQIYGIRLKEIIVAKVILGTFCCCKILYYALFNKHEPL